MLSAENPLRRRLSAGRNGGKFAALMGAVLYNRFCKELIHGYSSVDGEWIVAKKDWEEAKKRAKSKERRDKSKERKEQERKKSVPQAAAADSASTDDTSESGYTPEMDEQRCILYFHGGESHIGFNTCVTLVY